MSTNSNKKRPYFREFSQVEIDEIRNEHSEKIGSGGMADVYKCELDGRKVAVKVYNSDTFGYKEQFENEKIKLMELIHPHIVRLIGYGEGVLVLELLPYCLANRYQELNWEDTLKVLLQVAHALAFLHNEKKIYVDLKPANILLDEGNDACLCDFGAMIGGDKGKSEIYSEAYIAPEFFAKSNQLTFKSDIYSYGILVMQLIMRKDEEDIGTTRGRFKTHNRGNSDKNIVEIAQEMIRQKGGNHIVTKKLVETGCGPEDAKIIIDMAMKCLKQNPDQRYQSMGEIVQILENCKVVIPAVDPRLKMLNRKPV